jgi:hypothetical protein
VEPQAVTPPFTHASCGVISTGHARAFQTSPLVSSTVPLINFFTFTGNYRELFSHFGVSSHLIDDTIRDYIRLVINASERTDVFLIDPTEARAIQEKSSDPTSRMYRSFITRFRHEDILTNFNLIFIVIQPHAEHWGLIVVNVPTGTFFGFNAPKIFNFKNQDILLRTFFKNFLVLWDFIVKVHSFLRFHGHTFKKTLIHVGSMCVSLHASLLKEVPTLDSPMKTLRPFDVICCRNYNTNNFIPIRFLKMVSTSFSLFRLLQNPQVSSAIIANL